MIDWRKIYAEEVAPVIANFTSPPPLIVLAILGGLLLVGIALLLLAPGRLKFAGVILAFFVGFVGYMVISSYFKARDRPAHYEYGTIVRKFSEKSSRKDTRGIVVPVVTYFIELNVSAAHNFSEAGQGDALPERIGSQKLLVSEDLYHQLKAGEGIYGVLMPVADAAIHFAVRDDGSIVR